MPVRAAIAVLALAVVGVACSSAADGSAAETTSAGPESAVSTSSAFFSEAPDAEPAPSTTTGPSPANDGRLRNQARYVFPEAPALTNTGELAGNLAADLDSLWLNLTSDVVDVGAIEIVGASGDARLAWLVADLLRFFQGGPVHEALVDAFVELTGVELAADPIAELSPWQSVTDHLIAWDLATHPEYQDYKGQLFTLVEPGWQPFFDDASATIDWRLTSWGGVRIDNRPLGTTLPCEMGCIPALDDPVVTSAAEGSWYPDERIIFGLVTNGEARAYPKHQMEVHEMVNDTLGGRRVGIPYCTLCGSAQAYLTDAVPDRIEVPVLRTSGLLTRSNKVMFDLNTFSIIDTFTGEALSGPLREAGITLDQTTVITSTWADWKAAHPETTILAEDGGIGRSYRLDPLGSRDANGPIFPVGPVDPRLPIQAQVVGVITPDGTPVAFPAEGLRRAMDLADSVEFGGLVITADGGGFVATLEDGTPIASHQAFWFAWAQFHLDTLLWLPTQSDG
jgi:hypothetical protein